MLFFFIERHELMEKWYFLATQQVNTHDYCYLITVTCFSNSFRVRKLYK